MCRAVAPTRRSHNSGRKFRIQANHSGRNCASNSIEIILDSVDIKEGTRYDFRYVRVLAKITLLCLLSLNVTGHPLHLLRMMTISVMSLSPGSNHTRM